jgi:hypothetical protein
LHRNFCIDCFITTLYFHSITAPYQGFHVYSKVLAEIKRAAPTPAAVPSAVPVAAAPETVFTAPAVVAAASAGADAVAPAAATSSSSGGEGEKGSAKAEGEPVEEEGGWLCV